MSSGDATITVIYLDWNFSADDEKMRINLLRLITFYIHSRNFQEFPLQFILVGNFL